MSAGTSSGPVTRESARHYLWGDRCEAWHFLDRANLSFIVERMPVGTQEERHLHCRARQFFYVLSGSLEIELGKESHRVAAGAGLEIAPGLPHQVRNGGPAAAEFIVVSQPHAHGDRLDLPSMLAG